MLLITLHPSSQLCNYVALVFLAVHFNKSFNCSLHISEFPQQFVQFHRWCRVRSGLPSFGKCWISSKWKSQSFESRKLNILNYIFILTFDRGKFPVAIWSNGDATLFWCAFRNVLWNCRVRFYSLDFITQSGRMNKYFWTSSSATSSKGSINSFSIYLFSLKP